MKKNLFTGMLMAAAAIAFTACSSEDLVSGIQPESPKADNAIGFVNKADKMTRATSTLQSKNIYTFGVWGVKAGVGAIMSNYLVGYYDKTNNKGYYSGNATTLDNSSSLTDGKSLWFYEGLGSSETVTYTAFGSESQITSNVSTQTLKYWDTSKAYDFYAYTPYINGSTTPTFADGKITFQSAISGGTGTDVETALASTMVAHTTTAASVTNDVSLTFKRMNAKLNIAFWEDIKGYRVEIIDLGTNGGTTYNGVYALPVFSDVQPKSGTTPAEYKKTITIDGNSVTAGYTNSGTPIVAFSGEDPTFTYSGTPTRLSTAMNFAVPSGKSTSINGTSKNVIAESRTDALNSANGSISGTTYYLIPSQTTTATADIDQTDAKANSSLYFHVSFNLINEDNPADVITFTNVKVLVNAQYTQWQANKAYTYIFKITNKINGGHTDPNPDDPTIDDDPLKPIVFDGIYVEDDYSTETYEYIISNDDVNVAYTVVYDANGGTWTGDVTTKNEQVWSASAPTSVTTTAAPDNAPDGKTFKEWCTTSDGTGTKYNASASITPTYDSDKKVTLYAIWQ